MRVGERLVLVGMAVRLLAVPCECVFVPVMLVVDMLVLVRHGVVHVRVAMALAEMQPEMLFRIRAA